MTAEIAILNKSAVALAADSAVTIRAGGSAKIYDTANKIFEISEIQPLGLMIYGTPDFMGLPMETLIKKYRHDLAGKRVFSSVAECAADFIEFFEKFPNDLRYEKQNVDRIISDAIEGINKLAHDEFMDYTLRVGKYLPSKANRIFQNIVNIEIDRLSELEPAECFVDRHISMIDRRYIASIDRFIEEHCRWLNKITNETRVAIRQFVRLVLHRRELSRFRTGIVIAGFGEHDICPTLCSLELDGIINGRLKCSAMNVTDIGRHGPGASIQAFAQNEMVMRFMEGVDPAYDRYIENFVGEAMKTFSFSVFEALNLDESMIRRIMRDLASVISGIQADFSKRSDDHKKLHYGQNIMNMVQFMPKQEMAALAESLIDLTSLKRRVSAENETVGGEIDVAIISKYEGFVWIKRKHYFPSHLNPRFFRRQFGFDRGGEHGSFGEEGNGRTGQ